MKTLIEAQKQYLTIIKEATLNTLAKSNNTTVENVTLGILSGNENLTTQFKKLMEVAFNLDETKALGLA